MVSFSDIHHDKKSHSLFSRALWTASKDASFWWNISPSLTTVLERGQNRGHLIQHVCVRLLHVRTRACARVRVRRRTWAHVGVRARTYVCVRARAWWQPWRRHPRTRVRVRRRTWAHAGVRARTYVCVRERAWWQPWRRHPRTPLQCWKRKGIRGGPADAHVGPGAPPAS